MKYELMIRNEREASIRTDSSGRTNINCCVLYKHNLQQNLNQNKCKNLFVLEKL